MRVIFIGCVESSYVFLEKLQEIDIDIVGVVTKEKSSFNSDFKSLVPLCEKRNTPYHFTKNSNSVETVEWVREKKPDLIFCFGWSSILKQELLQIPRLGAVGFHPAALPLNRGRHPIVWALALGLEETASTFFMMDEEVDTGKIINQKVIGIDYKDDAKTLYHKILEAGKSQLEEICTAFSRGSITAVEQSSEGSNHWRKRGRSDGQIDFRFSSRTIYNLVRSLTKPYLGAHYELDGQDIKVWKVEEVEYSQNNIEPGKVISSEGNTFLVKSADGAIRVLEHGFTEIPKNGDYL